MFSQEFTQHSFPVHYYDMSPLLQYLKYHIEDTLPTSPLLAKVVLFELQCSVSFEAWRSATIRVLGFWYNQMPFQVYAQINRLSNTIPISKVPELCGYMARHQRALISLAYHKDKLLYVI